MGGCFSSVGSQSVAAPTAKVISVSGDLREYPIPLTVSEVLQMDNTNTSPSFFLCCSDSLYYDEFIPPLDAQDQLQPNQIYFLLPNTKLRYRMTASDMAALAVKASVAIQKGSEMAGRRRKKARISPVLEVSTKIAHHTPEKSLVKQSPVISRSGSVRKLQRYSSRRAKMAVRSFRLRLSTIDEGSVL